MKNQYILSLLLLSSSYSIAQWNPSTGINTPVCAMPNHQEDARIVTDAKAGAIISWVDARNTPGLGDIYVQRLNSRGNALWTSNGKAVCNHSADQTASVITEADNSSAIIAWQDWRSGDRDIYAQKVDSSGNMLWQNNGLAVCAKATHQRSPKILHDGSGGAFIVWEDSINGAYDIYVQRINASGTLMWNNQGLAVCTAVDAQINPRIIPDAEGGVIIAWQDRRNGQDYKVYAQRIDSLGNALWTANGIAICNSSNGQVNLKLESDFSGGAFIAWQDKRNGNDFDIYIQRINSSGQLLWASSGIGVCTVSGNQSAIDMATESGMNGAIITWKDERTGAFAVYAAFINRSGVLTWTNNGMGIGPGINPNIVGDGSAGAIITWQDESLSASNYNVYAQRLTTAGLKLWGVAGTAVCTAVFNQEAPKHVGTGDGGAIFVWNDLRNGSNYDVYAHKLSANGTTTSIAGFDDVSSKLNIYPNPAHESINFMLDDFSTEYKVTITDITGKVLIDLISSSYGKTQINIKDLSEGLYFLKVKNIESETESVRKFVKSNYRPE